MKVVKIEDCSQCHHRDHTGGFTIGGPKQLCHHPKAVKERLGAEGGQAKLRLHKYPKIPPWCPLEDG